MRHGRLKDSVLYSFGDRDEMSPDELRAVIFTQYSEAELLRRGSYSRGIKCRRAITYCAGECISELDRQKLLWAGVGLIVRKLKHSSVGWILFNKEKGVFVRVRKKLA